jgi:hypothetical protein
MGPPGADRPGLVTNETPFRSASPVEPCVNDWMPLRLAGAGLVVFCSVVGAGAAHAQTPSQAPPHPSNVIAQSNNPLSDLIGFNFNEYYASSLFAVDGVLSVLNLQAVIIPVKRHLDLYHIVRVTLPVVTAPVTPTSYESGLGDLVLQDAFKLSRAGAKTEWGVGPLLVAPTATSDALGAGKWQAGAAIVVIRLLEGGSVAGGLLTWQTDFAGDSARPGTSLVTFQPQIALALGATGFYISSSPIWTFDFFNDRHLIPFSVGFGKVMEIGTTIVNVSFEPQISVYHKGEQQPATQLFFGFTLQWKR